MKHLLLTGSPFERGFTHGTQLRAEIHDMLQRWDETLQADLEMGLLAYTSRYLADTDYMGASEKFAPDVMEETVGISAGAGIPIQIAFAIQAGLDEHWHHRESITSDHKSSVPHLEKQRWDKTSAKNGRASKSTPMDRCSGFGVVQSGQPTILAQNQDLPTYLDGAQVMLEVHDEENDVRILMPSIAGFIGLHGMNDKGIGNCVNTLAQLSCNTTGPLSTFVIRAMLNCHTFDDAVALVKAAGHTVGLNYIIADANQVIDLETSANQVVEYRPHPNRVFHTNHPLANDDFASKPVPHKSDPHKGEQSGEQVDEFNTNARMDVLQRELNNDEPVDAAKAKAILSCPDGHVCRLQQNPIPAFTFTSAVMELGEEPQMHVAAGPPSKVAYKTFRFG